MEFESKTAKYLITALIYPAVFGALIYEVIKCVYTEWFFVFKESQSLMPVTKFDYINMICTCIMVISLLVFYACDFLYATYTKDYGWCFFFFDIFILIGLYLTFNKLHYEDKKDSPELYWILGCFLSFMVWYILWDGYELIIIPKEYSNEKKEI